MSYDDRPAVGDWHYQAAALRLLLTTHDCITRRDDAAFDAREQVLDELGDCPHCLRNVIDHLAVFYLECFRESGGAVRDDCLARVEANLAQALDHAAEDGAR